MCNESTAAWTHDSLKQQSMVQTHHLLLCPLALLLLSSITRGVFQLRARDWFVIKLSSFCVVITSDGQTLSQTVTLVTTPLLFFKLFCCWYCRYWFDRFNFSFRKNKLLLHTDNMSPRVSYVIPHVSYVYFKFISLSMQYFYWHALQGIIDLVY